VTKPTEQLVYAGVVGIRLSACHAEQLSNTIPIIPKFLYVHTHLPTPASETHIDKDIKPLLMMHSSTLTILQKAN